MQLLNMTSHCTLELLQRLMLFVKPTRDFNAENHEGLGSSNGRGLNRRCSAHVAFQSQSSLRQLIIKSSRDPQSLLYGLFSVPSHGNNFANKLVHSERNLEQEEHGRMMLQWLRKVSAGHNGCMTLATTRAPITAHGFCNPSLRNKNELMSVVHTITKQTLSKVTREQLRRPVDVLGSCFVGCKRFLRGNINVLRVPEIKVLYRRESKRWSEREDLVKLKGIPHLHVSVRRL